MKFQFTLLAMLATATVFSGPAASRPDDRAVGPRSQPLAVQFVRPDDRGGTRGPAVTVYEPAVVGSSHPFDYGDAAIGAAIGGGFMLTLAGMALVVVHRRTRVAL
jgi:Na+-transporting methylmalonyl-CoA/oxaloacetate decarboxylase gamma subunit